MGRHDESEGNVLGVTLLAAAVGFVAGILLAPKSGVETRKDVKRHAKKLEVKARRGMEVARETVAEGKSELKTVAEGAMIDARELSADAKIRAKRTMEHAKTGAQHVESTARQAWSNKR